MDLLPSGFSAGACPGKDWFNGRDEMSNPVLYIVKSWISKEHAKEFNEWYHTIHMPQFMEASKCVKARRFRAIESEDKFMYMAIYEFADQETLLKYQESEAKKELVADFRKNYGGKAETKRSIWEQIYP